MSKHPIFLERQEERDALVDEYLIPNGIHDPRVIEAFRTVPRHALVGNKEQDEAYQDYPLSIGLQQTISQPLVVAKMTQGLGVEKGMKILEIGTGSGYQAAILRELGAEVYTVEILALLSFQAQKKLQLLGYTNIHFHIGDGYYGWPSMAPFDGVLLTAAPDQIPKPLIQQLRNNCKIILPLGKETQQLMEVRKEGDDFHWDNLGPVSFVGMVGRVDS